MNFSRIILFFIVMAITNLHAQQKYLRFNANGEFKIAQFTDIHFQYGNPASDIALERINEVLNIESPDLVVLTGDVIYSSPADKGLCQVLECVSSHNVPFVVTFGNHDDEQGMNRIQLYDIIRTIPGNLMPEHGGTVPIDLALSVKSSCLKEKDAAVLYFFDSHSYSRLDDVEGYGWLTFKQVENYRCQSSHFTEINNGDPLPALAFFHIPLPEYNQAAVCEEAVLIGTRMEKACAQGLNTGMFAAMKEAGDIMGIFVGHDHDNDYSVMWHGILLAYGRYSGGNTVYNHLSNGARIIVLKENQRTFETWVDLSDRMKVNHTIYPDSYIKK